MLENFIFDGRLSLQDSEFIENVGSDISEFVKNQSEKRVLVFPPFNSFRRYLLHQLVERNFVNLKTFSIGEGEERRTVVCFKKDFKYQDQVSGSAFAEQSRFKTPKQSDSNIEWTDSGNISSSNSRNVDRKRVKRARIMPSVSIYRPPAARKLEQNANLATLLHHHHHHHHHSHHGRDEVMGSDLPEESKFRFSEESRDGNPAAGVGRRNDVNGVSVFRNAISSIRSQSKVPGPCKNTESANGTGKRGGESVFPAANKIDDSGKYKLRRPDMQVYVPKGRRGGVSGCISVSSSSSNNGTDSSNSGVSIPGEDKNNSEVPEKSEFDQVPVEKEAKALEKAIDEVKSAGKKIDEVLLVSEVTESNSSVVEKNDVGEVVTSDSSQTFFQVPEILESSNSFVKLSSHISSESGCTKTTNETSASESDKKKCTGENENLKGKEIHLNPEECDWESMFDDTGECLDPSLLEQLTTAVGEVTIETPKTAYNDFKTKSLDVMGDEFPHVIEIYNFPPEFQLQDLMTVFSQFKNSGFEIKWVDDTHALGIFSSSAVVSEVLSFYHPFVKTRSLKEGTPLSKMKARRSAEFLLPYKPRPNTCPALARRLVTGALGVKLKTSREEREAERKILTEAREKKKLEAKQKEEAWEGTFS